MSTRNGNPKAIFQILRLGVIINGMIPLRTRAAAYGFPTDVGSFRSLKVVLASGGVATPQNTGDRNIVTGQESFLDVGNATGLCCSQLGGFLD